MRSPGRPSATVSRNLNFCRSCPVFLGTWGPLTGQPPLRRPRFAAAPCFFPCPVLAVRRLSVRGWFGPGAFVLGVLPWFVCLRCLWFVRGLLRFGRLRPWGRVLAALFGSFGSSLARVVWPGEAGRWPGGLRASRVSGGAAVFSCLCPVCARRFRVSGPSSCLACACAVLRPGWRLGPFGVPVPPAVLSLRVRPW